MFHVEHYAFNEPIDCNFQDQTLFLERVIEDSHRRFSRGICGIFGSGKIELAFPVILL